MARIELMNPETISDVRVPVAEESLQSAGLQGEAMQKLGETVGQLGIKLMNKRVQADNTNFAFTRSQALSHDTQQYMDQLKLSSPAGAPGYAQKVQDFIDQRISKDQDDATTSGASDLYLKAVTPLQNRLSLDAQQYEGMERAKKYQADDQNMVNQKAGDYLNNPLNAIRNFDSDVKAFDLHFRQNVGANYTDDTYQQQIKNTKSTLATAVLNGLKSQQQYGVAQKILKSDGLISQSLDPKVKGAWLNQLSNDIENRDAVRASVIHENVNDAMYALSNGISVPDSTLNGLVAQMKTNKAFPPEIRSSIMNKINQSKQIGNDFKLAQDMPRSQWTSLTSAQDPNKGPIKGIAARADLQGKFIGALNRLQKQQDADPVSSVLQARPDMQSLYAQAQDHNDPQATQNYVSQMLAQQKRLEIPNPRILSNDEASHLGDMINKAPNAAGAAQIMTNLQNTYGTYFPKMMSDLVESQKKGGGGVDQNMAIAAFLPDEASRTRVIENVRNAKAVDKEFSDMFPGISPKGVSTAVSLRASGALNAINSGASDGSDASLAVSLQNQIATETKKIMNYSPGTKLDDAADQAYQRIVGNNFSVVNAGRSSILVPTSMAPNDPDLVRGFIGYNSTSEGLKNLGVAVPKTYADKDAFYDSLAQTSKWVTNSDHSGIQLVQDLNGVVTPVYDSDGKTITRNFKEIANGADRNTVDYSMQMPMSTLKF